MSDREIKTCVMCGDDDMIKSGKSHCDDCLEKNRLKRKDILSV